MSTLEYRDLDAAAKTALAELVDLQGDGTLVAIRDVATGRWTCRVGGPGDVVVETDSFDLMLEFLADHGLLVRGRETKQEHDPATD